MQVEGRGDDVNRETLAWVVLGVMGLLVVAVAAAANLFAALVVAVLGLSGWVAALRGSHPRGRSKPGLDSLLGRDDRF